MSSSGTIRTEPTLSPSKAAPPSPDHLVRFYEDEGTLAAVVARFLADGLEAGDRMMVAAPEPHVEAFRRRLESDG